MNDTLRTLGLIVFVSYLSPIMQAAEMTRNGDWVAFSRSDGSVYAVQCGLDAVVFALEHWNIEYPLAKVSEALPLTQAGISLADVHQVLLAFGLDAAARKDVNVRALTRALEADTLAIVPLRLPNGRAHYFVALLNDDGEPVVVDPPRKVWALPGGISEERLAKSGGVVLLVRRAKTGKKPMAESVQASPMTVELG